MDVRKIVAEIDAKIASLQQARAVLVELDESAVMAKAAARTPQGKHQRSEGSVGEDCEACSAQAQSEPRRAQAHCRRDEAPLGRAPQSREEGSGAEERIVGEEVGLANRV